MALLDEQPYVGYPQMGRRRAMPNRDVEINQGLLRGASYYPYDLLGSPVDLINMAFTPLGLGSEKPVMGSAYLQSLAQRAGLSAQPTGSNAENVARLATALTNPAAGARAVGRVVEPTVQALAPKAAQMTEDYLRSVGGIADVVPLNKMNEMSWEKPKKPKNSVLVDIPLDKIEHGESAMSGGKLTWPTAKQTIKEYADRKTDFPPIEVMGNDPNYEYFDKPFMIYDGSHRYEAAKLRGDKSIKAYVRKDDEEALNALKGLLD